MIPLHAHAFAGLATTIFVMLVGLGSMMGSVITMLVRREPSTAQRPQAHNRVGAS